MSGKKDKGKEEVEEDVGLGDGVNGEVTGEQAKKETKARNKFFEKALAPNKVWPGAKAEAYIAKKGVAAYLSKLRKVVKVYMNDAKHSVMRTRELTGYILPYFGVEVPVGGDASETARLLLDTICGLLNPLDGVVHGLDDIAHAHKVWSLIQDHVITLKGNIKKHLGTARELVGGSASLLTPPGSSSPDSLVADESQSKDVIDVVEVDDHRRNTVVVMAETSAGKSTFLNALLGHEVLPTHMLHCTTHVCVLEHPPEETGGLIRLYRAVTGSSSLHEGTKREPIWTQDEAAPESKEAAAEAIRTMIKAVSAEYENDLSIHFVVHWPCKLLNAGIRLVDAPGLNRSEVQTALVKRYASRALAIIGLVPVEEYQLTQSMAESLNQVCGMAGGSPSPNVDGDRVMLVMTKTDTCEGLPRLQDREDILLAEWAAHFATQGNPWNPANYARLNCLALLRCAKYEVGSGEVAAFTSSLARFLGSLYHTAGCATFRALADHLDGATLRLDQALTLANRTSEEDATRKQEFEALIAARDKAMSALKASSLRKTFKNQLRGLVAQIEGRSVEILERVEALFQAAVRDQPSLEDISKTRKESANLYYDYLEEERMKAFVQVVVDECKRAAESVRQVQGRHVATQILDFVEGLDVLSESLSAHSMASSASERAENMVNAADAKLHTGSFFQWAWSAVRNVFKRLVRSRWSLDAIKEAPWMEFVNAFYEDERVTTEEFVGAFSGSMEAWRDEMLESVVESMKREFDKQQDVQDLTDRLREVEGLNNELATLRENVKGTRESLVLRMLPYAGDGLVNVRFEDLEIDADPVGTGRFGTVYGGRWTQRHLHVVGGEGDETVVEREKTIPVALKKVVMDGDVMGALKALEETRIGMTLSHRSVVRAFGIAIKTEVKTSRVSGTECVVHNTWIVFEKGTCDLDTWLREMPHLTREHVLDLLLDVASGLEFAHSNGFIHRDVALENIIVFQTPDGRPVGKLSDFGESRQETEAQMTADVGRVLWRAPEMFGSDEHGRTSYTAKVDTYSFGVLMWVLARTLANRTAAGESGAPSSPPPPPRGKHITKVFSPSDREAVGDTFADLADRCLEKDPKDRPSWSEILSTLRSEKEGQGAQMVSSKGGLRVLAIDGGGSRGVIPAAILRVLEAVTGERVGDLFDLMGGTSAGGLLSLALSTPDIRKGRVMTGAEALDFCFEAAPEIFRSRMWLHQQLSQRAMYSARPLRTFLTSTFGDQSMGSPAAEGESEKKSARVFVTTKKDSRPAAHLLRSFRHAGVSDPNEGEYGWQVADAGRATSAAPLYLPAFELNGHVYEDGGVGFNNPASLALEEAKALARAEGRPGVSFLLSLGTGVEGSVSGGGGVTRKGLLSTVSSITATVNHLVGTATCHEVVHDELMNKTGINGELHGKYARFDVTIHDPSLQPLTLKKREQLAALVAMAEKETMCSEFITMCRKLGGDETRIAEFEGLVEELEAAKEDGDLGVVLEKEAEIRAWVSDH